MKNLEESKLKLREALLGRSEMLARVDMARLTPGSLLCSSGRLSALLSVFLPFSLKTPETPGGEW